MNSKAWTRNHDAHVLFLATMAWQPNGTRTSLLGVQLTFLNCRKVSVEASVSESSSLDDSMSSVRFRVGSWSSAGLGLKNRTYILNR